jgi:4-diphosphocytidyl-2-C-methyl-D-erythritol kinase
MRARAKINLSLVVGPLRPDGKHEVVTVLQRIELSDLVVLEESSRDGITIDGFAEDTLVRAALEAFAEAAGVTPRWHVRLEKSIPLAAGLGGGSSDAAAALQLANSSLAQPLPADQLISRAALLGVDVPFFLTDRPQLGTGDGTVLSALDVPQDYTVLVALPNDAVKESTASVYRDFDRRGAAAGFEERRAALLQALSGVVHVRDLARLPRNDLLSSPLAVELERLGSFRSDVSGAGPAVYALFDSRADAERAEAVVRESATTWIVDPVA